MKKLYIYNDSNNKQRAEWFTNRVTETVLWEGFSWEQFEEETGLTREQVGGLEIQNNKLVYSESRKQVENEKLKPPATGEALRGFLLRAVKEGKLAELSASQEALADFNIAIAGFVPVLQNIDALNGGFINEKQVNLYAKKLFQSLGNRITANQKRAIDAVVADFIDAHQFQA